MYETTHRMGRNFSFGKRGLITHQSFCCRTDIPVLRLNFAA